MPHSDRLLLFEPCSPSLVSSLSQRRLGLCHVETTIHDLKLAAGSLRVLRGSHGRIGQRKHQYMFPNKLENLEGLYSAA